MKLVGFAVWEGHNGKRNVTLPMRQYAVNGERRWYILLRPVGDTGSADTLRDEIARAFEETEATRSGVAS